MRLLPAAPRPAFLPCAPLAAHTAWHGAASSRLVTQQRSPPRAPRRRARAPVALLDAGAVSRALVVLAEEDMTRRIFVGGLGIISSGFVGATVVGFIVRARYDELETELREESDAADRDRNP